MKQDEHGCETECLSDEEDASVHPHAMYLNVSLDCVVHVPSTPFFAKFPFKMRKQFSKFGLVPCDLSEIMMPAELTSNEVETVQQEFSNNVNGTPSMMDTTFGSVAKLFKLKKRTNFYVQGKVQSIRVDGINSHEPTLIAMKTCEKERDYFPWNESITQTQYIDICKVTLLSRLVLGHHVNSVRSQASVRTLAKYRTCGLLVSENFSIMIVIQPHLTFRKFQEKSIVPQRNNKQQQQHHYHQVLYKCIEYFKIDFKVFETRKQSEVLNLVAHLKHQMKSIEEIDAKLFEEHAARIKSQQFDAVWVPPFMGIPIIVERKRKLRELVAHVKHKSEKILHLIEDEELEEDM